MRKYQQKQILQLIQSMRQAQSAGLYADCQEGAVSIGNFIESIEGEGTKTVALLEEYCELLFKASNGEIKEKLLRKHLIKIENSITDELKSNRIEIVFLPYKVSMWDSLESIYLAAKADPNCNAYVVPIPSYELNANGTLGKMYYDGDQYPKDIPVVDWQAYNIEACHPDVVFTHYAYDDNVSNASIHPDFYSKRLREHCDSLVYVPYFVTVGDSVDEYCGYLPGVLYAHHVIVQSEAVRQSYIGHYKKFDKEHGLKGRFGKAEEKFLALGSPKFDKVINTRCEDCELPEEWKRLIYKPDGSRKKIVFYNTHMFAWINGGSEYFEKLRFVFDLFRDREDVVLWWRPHPNTEMNFRVKRPEWFDEYKSLVDAYKRESWGIDDRRPAPFIYDDSPLLYRAIAWADAYYGDMSSLVALFGITGKSIMLQDVSGGNNACKVINLLDTGEKIHFSDSKTNALMSINKSDCAIEYVASFPNESIFKKDLFYDSVIFNDSIYFAPMQAGYIACFDLKQRKIQQISIRENALLQKPLFNTFNSKVTNALNNSYKNSFYEVLKHQNFLYFIPYLYSAIVRYDIDSGEIDYCDEWLQTIIRKNNDMQHGIFRRGALIGDSLFLPCVNTNNVLEINLLTLSTKFHSVGTEELKIFWLCFDGNDFWLSSVDNSIYKWSLSDTQPTRVFSDDVAIDGLLWYTLNYSDGYVFVLSYKKKELTLINIKDGNFSKQLLTEAVDSNRYTVYGAGKVIDGNFYIQTAANGELNEYSSTTHMITNRIKMEYPMKFKEFFWDSLHKSQPDDFLIENKGLSIYDYLYFINEADIALKNNTPNNTGDAGSKIYSFVCKEVLDGA